MTQANTDTRREIVDADYYPLFCTARVPSTVIEDLLKQSILSQAGNIWSLMRTTKQTDFEKPTQVPVAGFETDFIDASHDTLGEFCLSNFPSNARIQPNYFGIMDERSMDDSTLLVVKWELWAERKDPNNDFDLENKEGWQTVRVRFGGAADFITRVEYLPLEEHLSGDDVLDEEGVYKLLG